MRGKSAFSIILVLLAASLLGSAFSCDTLVNPLTASNQSAADENAQLHKGPDFKSTSGFQDLSHESLADVSDEKCWNFNEAIQWHDFAVVDEDSVEIVVGLNDFLSNCCTELRHIITLYGGSIVRTVSIKGKPEAVVVDVPFTSASSFAALVKSKGLSKYVEPNVKFRTQLVPNDPQWIQQWGPRKIEADWVWNTTTGSHSVRLAVIDTGVDWDHPDLAANYVALGYDWVNNDADPMDDYDHGTFCAGIIAAVTNNNVGIAGLAQVEIIAEKVFDSQGDGGDVGISNAIIHAVDAGAKIISMSFGGYMPSELLHQAIRYAYESGVLLVAGAGNDETDYTFYPAAYEEVIAVAATDQYDAPAYFSNYGEWVELAAPGVDIYSTAWNDNYRTWSGTSFACPHVVGVAALIWSRFPDASRDWVRLRLQSTADDLGASGFDIHYGHGRINARKALTATPPEHDFAVSEVRLPAYLQMGTAAYINTTVTNIGNNVESNAQVEVFVDGALQHTFILDSLANGSSITLTTPWIPQLWGMHNVTSRVTPVAGETVLENNVASIYVYVGSGTVYIRSDGSVDPSSASIERVGNTYYFNNDVHDEIIVERDNITLNGNDYTLQGGGTKCGFQLSGRTNVTIENMHIDGFETAVMSDSSININISRSCITNNLACGIFLNSSAYCILTENIISFNLVGIEMDECFNNTVSRNAIKDNGDSDIFLHNSSANMIAYNNMTNYGGFGVYRIAINVEYSIFNCIVGNYIAHDNYGVCLYSSSNNRISHNNFVNNIVKVYSWDSTNIWDDGYPSGGNYWSSYHGVDLFSGPDQDQPGSDGVGDTSYSVAESDRDRYPLMNEAIHDICVTDVGFSKDTVDKGYTLNINVTAANQGSYPESFNIVLYANETVISLSENISLTSSESTSILFVWNTSGFAVGNYTIKAYAELLPNEIDLTGNLMEKGPLIVTILGDVDGDWAVTILDVVKITSIYSMARGNPLFKPNSDIDDDGVITILDVVICTSHYGQRQP